MRIYLFLFVAAMTAAVQTAAAQSVAVEETEIGLQNVRDRTIVRCYGSGDGAGSAEECARYFEQKGYVRFRDIPYKTANYDFLKVDTYPTRRWRDSEATPRW